MQLTIVPMEPHLSFTVPSIHDDTTLDCRLYYSAKQLVGITKESQRIQGAIISHPYAPLGGCQDDPVVSMIVSEMTKRSLGFVCTFNFRYRVHMLDSDVDSILMISQRCLWLDRAHKLDWQGRAG